MSKESLEANKKEIAIKEQRVRDFLTAQGLNALVLTTQANFAWFTCGGDNRVVNAADNGVASAVITPDAKYIICDNIEARRIAEEEVGTQGFEFRTFNWWESGMPKELMKIVKEPIGSDTLIPDTEFFAGKIAPLRYSLTQFEVERYHQLGQDTGECLAKSCKEISPGMTEHQIASILGEKLVSKGIIPNLILVATDERIENYRHPIPTDKTLEKYAMVVTCARKWGLIVSATRIVHFGPVSSALRDKHEAVMAVDAEFIAHTRPGTSVDYIFRKGKEMYAKTGYADEWKLHHQGGPTGYAGRDYRAQEGVEGEVQVNQAFAWNPSITGTKSEDTIIAMGDRTEIISAYGDWPVKPVEAESMVVARPDILEL